MDAANRADVANMNNRQAAAASDKLRRDADRETERRNRCAADAGAAHYMGGSTYSDC